MPLTRRAEHPLIFGAYKLREVRSALARLRASMDAIGEYLAEPYENCNLRALGPCCTVDDKAYWLKGLPMHVAEMLGYDILPAIAALTGDGIPETDVERELSSALASSRRLLKDCETRHARLKVGIESEYQAMKSGYSDLHALLVDADGIAERALQLIEWSEARTIYTERAALGTWWD